MARNLERFVDGIVVRTGPHEVALELAAQAGIPVINGLTLREHPCQALADVFTMRERFGRLDGLVVAFVGDGNNVYHSLALLGAALGMEIRLAHPAGYAPNERIVARAAELAEASGGRLTFGHDPRAAVRGAAVVYTDAWTSMGQEAETEERRDAFAGFARRRRPARRRGPRRRRRDALPAGASRRGDHLGSHGRAAQPDLGAVGEPAARPEVAARRAHRRGGGGMSDARYDQYREALRLGHVATQHDHHDAAAAAYRDATRLAPDRALPFIGLGRRAGQPRPSRRGHRRLHRCARSRPG